MRKIAFLVVLSSRDVGVANEILMHFRSQKKSSQDVSLSDCIETGSDGAELPLMEVISGKQDLLEDLSDREAAQQVRMAVQTGLTPREQQVIMLRYGLGGMEPRRQREVARTVGISRSYVSRIEKRALTKLRSILEGGRQCDG